MGGIPGCIKDLITRNVVKLKNICFAVIDEADEMLDYGFLPDIRHILSEDGKKLPVVTHLIQEASPRLMLIFCNIRRRMKNVVLFLLLIS